MALKAASSLMSYTGPDGCMHSRELVDGPDGETIAAPDWVIECGPCEASLVGHELWGPANEPAPLTADEMRQRDAQHADATRNLWQGLAAVPEQLAMLAAQNQGTMMILAKMMGVDVSNGLPPIPANMLPPGMVQGHAPAMPPPAVQDAPPAATAEKSAKAPAAPAKDTAKPGLTPQQKAAATKAAKKAVASKPDAG